MLLRNEYLDIEAEIKVNKDVSEIIDTVIVDVKAFGYELSKPGFEAASTFISKIDKFESSKDLSEAICVFDSIKSCFCMSVLEEQDFEKELIETRARDLVFDELQKNVLTNYSINEYLETISSIIPKYGVKLLLDEIKLLEVYTSCIMATLEE